MKKEKWANIALWVGLATLVMLVIITSIILHAKRQKLEDLNHKNDIVKPDESQENQSQMKNNKIILKNIEIFIDKDLNF